MGTKHGSFWEDLRRKVQSRVLLFLALLALVSFTACQGCPDPPPDGSQFEGTQPNIVFILLDDFGYGFYDDLDGTDTPHFDAFAAQGTSFRQYYVNAPICSPTRAAMLTGQYPLRSGFYTAIPNSGIHLGVPKDVVTLPEMLSAAGYHTIQMGKWHTGIDLEEFFPHAMADEVVMFRGGDDFYHNPYLHIDDEITRHEGHNTELLTDQAIDFLRRNQDQRFFMNIWYRAPHKAGVLEQEKWAPERWWNHFPQFADDPDRRAYSALISLADEQVGRILATLDELGLSDDTLVVLTGDNGGYRTSGSEWPLNGPLKSGKGRVYEGGIRVPMMVRWPGRVPAGQNNQDSLLTGFDFYPTFARLAGADVSTTRLDGVDMLDQLIAVVPEDPQEGGPDEEASGPNKQASGPTKQASGPGEQASGPDRQASDPEETDVVFLPQRPAPLVWEIRGVTGNAPYQDAYAVRDGKWKLVVLRGGQDEKARVRSALFDLSTDIGEEKNLVKQNPDVAQRLQEAYDLWELDAGRVHYQVAERSGDVEVTAEPEWKLDGSAPRPGQFRFNGGHLTLARDTRLFIFDRMFTFSARVRPEAAPAAGSTSVLATKPDVWRLELDSDLYPVLTLWSADGTTTTLRGERALPLDRWSHLVFRQRGSVEPAVRNGAKRGRGETIFYLNGEVVASSDQVHALQPIDNQVLLGNNAAGDAAYLGQMDDLQLFLTNFWNIESLFDTHGSPPTTAATPSSSPQGSAPPAMNQRELSDYRARFGPEADCRIVDLAHWFPPA